MDFERSRHARPASRDLPHEVATNQTGLSPGPALGRRFIPSAMRERHAESGSIDVSARINEPRLEVRPYKREGGSGERIAERDRFERHVTAVVGCPRLVRPRVERDARCDGPWGHGNTGAGGRGKAAAP